MPGERRGRELACYEHFCSRGRRGERGPLSAIVGHLQWLLIRDRARLEPAEDSWRGRREREAEPGASVGPHWHPHIGTPPHVWGYTQVQPPPASPPSLLQPPHSNWFRSCLAPSGQGPSILAGVTGLCCSLTVLLYWCCAASYYCANENLAPDIIFFFTGCALSMQNILSAFIGLKSTHYF